MEVGNLPGLQQPHVLSMWIAPTLSSLQLEVAAWLQAACLPSPTLTARQPQQLLEDGMGKGGEKGGGARGLRGVPCNSGQCRHEAAVAQQGLGGRAAAAEVLEHLLWGPGAAQGKHCVAEAAPRRLDLFLILQADLLESCKCVRREDLGPLVGVVSRRVAASKDVGEAAQEPVLREGRHHHRLLSDLPVDVKDGGITARGVPAVELQVNKAEVDLAEHHASTAERAGRQQLLVHLLWQLLARLVVTSKRVESLTVVAPVLHEL
mmetsp:Transcript_31219/g.88539  ORF Transcript_31219/g.88539 Transcript_31219/m.88539 type:complete len:263 (+) Transcript_31219:81-869(+)